MKWESSPGICPQCKKIISAAQFVSGAHQCEEESK